MLDTTAQPGASSATLVSPASAQPAGPEPEPEPRLEPKAEPKAEPEAVQAGPGPELEPEAEPELELGPVPEPELATVQKLLTIIITTSPIQSHPSSKLLEDVLDSFQHVPDLCSCRKLLVCDGFKVTPHKHKDGGGTNNQSKKGLVSTEVGRRYEEFVDSVTERATAGVHPFSSGTTEVIRLQKHMGFAYAVKEALTRVDTRYVMVVQHDFAFVRSFDLRAVLNAMVAEPEVLK